MELLLMYSFFVADNFSILLERLSCWKRRIEPYDGLSIRIYYPKTGVTSGEYLYAISKDDYFENNMTDNASD